MADQTAYEEKLRRVTDLLRPTDRVLEIGCGTGGTARHLARVADHVTATDLSAEMIRIAKARSQKDTGSSPDFLQAEAGKHLGGKPFDAVCAFSLLHLVDDIPSVLDVVFQQVKPGGYFLSKTVCLKDGARWMQWMVRLLVATRVAPTVTLISRAELTRHLTHAGFDVVETRYFGKKQINPFIVARRPSDCSALPTNTQ
ncbi:MAG: class I SAM-dependent methyltransferase [Pseudomonadota bacterium]